MNGAYLREEGLDIPDALAYTRDHGSLKGYPHAQLISNSELLELKCDVLIPAALENQITSANAGRLQTRILLEAANGPTTPEADEIMHKRGIVVVPDVLANAGGVIVSYFEWVQGLQSFFWDEQDINSRLEKIMVTNFERVWKMSRSKDVEMRTGAYILAIDRVAKAAELRGLYP